MEIRTTRILDISTMYSWGEECEVIYNAIDNYVKSIKIIELNCMENAYTLYTAIDNSSTYNTWFFYHHKDVLFGELVYFFEISNDLCEGGEQLDFGHVVVITKEYYEMYLLNSIIKKMPIYDYDDVSDCEYKYYSLVINTAEKMASARHLQLYSTIQYINQI